MNLFKMILNKATRFISKGENSEKIVSMIDESRYTTEEQAKHNENQNENQFELNKSNANNSKGFISGARPFIMYVLGVIVLYICVIRDFIGMCFDVNEVLPVSITEILLLLGSMVGIRQIEKNNQRKHKN